MNACPITGEPLLNPGQTVSTTALQQLRNATNDLAGLMTTLNHMLAGAGTPQRGATTRKTPSSTPPINLSILTHIDDHRDTIEAWAFHIMQHVNPAWRMPRGHTWLTIQHIYQRHIPTLTQWEYAPNMCDELGDALHHLTRLLNPPPTPININTDQLANRYFTYETAKQILQHQHGRTLNPSTVRTWKQRGHLTTDTRGRLLLADLLRLTDPT